MFNQRDEGGRGLGSGPLFFPVLAETLTRRGVSSHAWKSFLSRLVVSDVMQQGKSPWEERRGFLPQEAKIGCVCHHPQSFLAQCIPANHYLWG